MDVLVSLRIGGYVVEVQIHLKPVLDLKKDGGHKTFKWARRYLGAEDRYVGEHVEGQCPVRSRIGTCCK